jgi:uncharacterized membrane protein
MGVSFSMTRVSALRDRLNSSFWFAPALMAAAVLSFAPFEGDTLRSDSNMDDPSALYTFGPEGARLFSRVVGPMPRGASRTPPPASSSSQPRDRV